MTVKAATPARRTSRGGLEHFERAGLRFDVVDEGRRDGECFVLLHGFPGSSTTWRGVRSQLETAGYRTLTADQRGYSRSKQMSKKLAWMRWLAIIPIVIAVPCLFFGLIWQAAVQSASSA
jgi:pimeloyl-ACP methyl ester carboxylesterase